MADKKNSSKKKPSEAVKEEKTESKEKVVSEKAAPDERDKEIENLKSELDKQKDLLLRTAAEFDNYKRRTEKESIASAEYTKANLLKKLLPIFDNIDRSATAEKKSAEYVKGIEMTVKLLSDAVEGLGLVKIGKEGENFDPKFHEAVMHIEDESMDENVICKVLQVGYKIGDTVIRPAMVQVAN